MHIYSICTYISHTCTYINTHTYVHIHYIYTYTYIYICMCAHIFLEKCQHGTGMPLLPIFFFTLAARADLIDDFRDFEKPDLPAFLDYDCDLVSTKPGAAADWNRVYERVRSSFNGANPLRTNFSFPAEFEHLVVDRSDKSISRAQNLPEKALDECPLGSLYLLLLYYYSEFTTRGHRHKAAEQEIQNLLATYPTYALALTRWPIFPVLAHFSKLHHTPAEVVLCDTVEGVINWGECRTLCA